MRIIVGNPVPAKHLPDSYSVELSLRGGDDDYSQNVSIGGFHLEQDMELFENLIELLSRIEKAFPHGRGGGPEFGYDRIQGFEPWFNEDYDASLNAGFNKHSSMSPEEQSASLELHEKILAFYDRTQKEVSLYNTEGGYVFWPYDATCEDSEATLDSFKVYYHGVDGIVYNVSVED